MPRPTILLIDNDAASYESITEVIGSRAVVKRASTLESGLSEWSHAIWNAVVLSLNLPAVDTELVRQLLLRHRDSAVVLTTSHPTSQLVIEASRLGALGVLPTPVNPDALLSKLREVLVPAQRAVPIAPEVVGDPDAAQVIVGSCPEMLAACHTIGRVAPSSATVLIVGASGSGKDLVARVIHRNSHRAGGPFVAMNCAAIPESLLESELFGYEKGAFPGAVGSRAGRIERASGGTLFLEAIGELGPSLQAKLMRALQAREVERIGGEARIPVDVRVIAATGRDLRQAVEAGAFREDLYYHIGVVTLSLPPLAERGEDLARLIHYFLAGFARRYDRPLRRIAPGTLDRLQAHSWPGNVRELRNVLERAVLLSQGTVLLPEHLPKDWRTGEVPVSTVGTLRGYSPDLPLAEVERLHIQEVIRRSGGHLGQAAEVLGLHRNTLTRKVRDYGFRT